MPGGGAKCTRRRRGACRAVAVAGVCLGLAAPARTPVCAVPCQPWQRALRGSDADLTRRHAKRAVCAVRAVRGKWPPVAAATVTVTITAKASVAVAAGQCGRAE